MDRVFFLLIGYCFGLIQTAYIVGRLMGKIDIREHGSKNAGSTNVKRVMGWKAALIVFILDILKAVGACLCCSLIAAGPMFPLSPVAVMYAGLGVIIGHDFPFYLDFKGGKGIASSVGILFCINFAFCWIVFAATIAIIAVSRYLSLGSLALSIMLIALVIFTYPNAESIILAIIIAAIAFFQHRGNISRLLKGTERRFTMK